MRERANKETSSYFLVKKVIFCEINPEGTCGPIWLGMVPWFRSCSWLHFGVKKIVDKSRSKYPNK